MARTPEELRVLRQYSIELQARSAELRRLAEVARNRGLDCRTSGQAARAHSKTSRIHAEGAHKRQDER
jgi:hypothetical protein